MDKLLGGLENSAVARTVQESLWIFPTLETLHFLGLILLVGSLFLVDLRLLGFAVRAPVRSVMSFVPIAAIGFGINLVTGILFFVSDPFRYFPNPAFQVKLGLVVLAGLNLLWFRSAVDWAEMQGNPAYRPSTALRTVAIISAVLWLAVIVCGRLIPYV